MLLSEEITRERGIELAIEITNILNGIIRADGWLDHDDPRIWEQWLDKRTRQDWADLLHVLGLMEECMDAGQSKQFMRVVLHWNKNKHREWPMGHPKKRKDKKAPWSAINLTRELINSAQGLYLPNRAPDKQA